MNEELFDIENKWQHENQFYLTSEPSRIAKMIAHYELYKSIVNIPGHLVECGVYKGASFTRFATFRDMLENQISRKLIGFDIFGKFPQVKGEHDSKFIQEFEQAGGKGINIELLEKVFEYKGFRNYELVQGNILETVPEYVQTHPELKIALLHLDVDVYEPSKIVLESLFQRIVPGGLLILDDYGTVEGETRAVDEFFENRSVRFEKLPVAHIPAFVRV